VHPVTLDVLQRMNFQVDELRSKSWDEFARPDSPPLDFVFTVCDQAALETCPVWPGQPMTAHWGIEDPAAFVGPPELQLRAFQRAYMELDARIRIFTNLRLEELDKLALQRRLDEIGEARRISAEAG
jgi:arsenate reductase